jgi:hypothetical protein
MLNSTQRTTKRLRTPGLRKLPKSVIITPIHIFSCLLIVTSYARARLLDYLQALHQLGVVGNVVSKTPFQTLNVMGHGNLRSRLFQHPVYSKEVLQYEPAIVKSRGLPPDWGTPYRSHGQYTVLIKIH